MVSKTADTLVLGREMQAEAARTMMKWLVFLGMETVCVSLVGWTLHSRSETLMLTEEPWRRTDQSQASAMRRILDTCISAMSRVLGT